MCTHNICFEQIYENRQTISPENCHFYSREKSLYIAWACFRNDLTTYYVAYLPIYYLSCRHICSVLSTQYHAIQYVCSSLHNVRCHPNYPVVSDASHGTYRRQSGYHSLPRGTRLHVRCRCLQAIETILGYHLKQE